MRRRKPENILRTADRITSGARNRDYGHPADNHGCTAELWSAWLRRRHGLDIRLTSEDVCVLNRLQKESRLANTPGHHDSLVDIGGYARNQQMIRERT